MTTSISSTSRRKNVNSRSPHFLQLSLACLDLHRYPKDANLKTTHRLIEFDFIGSLQRMGQSDYGSMVTTYRFPRKRILAEGKRNAKPMENRPQHFISMQNMLTPESSRTYSQTLNTYRSTDTGTAATPEPRPSYFLLLWTALTLQHAARRIYDCRPDASIAFASRIIAAAARSTSLAVVCLDEVRGGEEGRQRAQRTAEQDAP